MQVGNNILNSYEMHLQDNVKTEGGKAAEQPGQVKSSTDISGLKEGMVFKGEILDIVGEKVQIALENRSQLMARLQEGVQLGVGDKLLFSVQENNASQILIKPLFDSLYSAQTQVLEKALDMTGLSPTEKNFSVAKELMEAGLPLDKGNMVKLLSQSMKFPETSMQTLVALNKMNIPVTEANIAQFERYQEYNHQLSGDIAQAADNMATFTESFPPGTPASTLLSVAGEILDMFMQDMQGVTGEENAAVADTLIEEEGQQTVTNPSAGETAVQAENEAEAQLVNGKETLDGSEAKSAADGAEVKQAADGVEARLAADSKVLSEAEGKNINEKEAISGKASVAEQAEVNKPEGKNTLLSNLMEKTGLSKEEVNNLTNTLQKAEIPREQIVQIYKESGSTEDLLKNITQALNNSDISDQAIRNMLESSEFKKLFADMIKKSWALNPKDMKDPKEIDELYNKIMKQSKGFEDAIAAKGGDTKNFNQNFQNMRQNMQFMEQLNNQMIYAQMPLKLSNQNANSELFIYADKRKIAEKKDGISVMLHLDMDHLGQTDIHVTLTGSNVNARFYLNDQQSVDIVAENMVQLAKQLADRGFSLTNEVIKRQPQESINKVVDEIIDENAERSIKRYTFDART